MDNTIAFSPISFRLQTSGFLFPNKMRTKVEKKNKQSQTTFHPFP